MDAVCPLSSIVPPIKGVAHQMARISLSAEKRNKLVSTFFVGILILHSLGCTSLFRPHNKALMGAIPYGISSMLKVGNNSFLLVYDKKLWRDAGARLAVLHLKATGTTYQEIEFDNLSAGELPSDLESVCAIPDKSGHLLLGESGFYRGYQGRIFHVLLEKNNDRWSAKSLELFLPLPLPETDKQYSTPSHAEIEGMACIKTEDEKLRLILVKRGSKDKPASLVIGELRGIGSGTPEFLTKQELPIPTPSDIMAWAHRYAADLHLKPIDKRMWEIWTMATRDPGDFGPFRSEIYSPGVLNWKSDGIFELSQTTQSSTWRVEGLKVEALVDPAEIVQDSVFAIGSDDEDLGGAWRSLGPAQ